MTTSSYTSESRLREVTERFLAGRAFQRVVDALFVEPEGTCTVAGLHGSADSLMIAGLAERAEGPVVLIAEDSVMANNLYEDLLFLMGDEAVGHYPARQILPYDFRAPVGEIMGRRINTLTRLLSNQVQVAVCSIRALIEPTITKSLLAESSISLTPGQEVEIEDLTGSLVKHGFRRVPLVEEVGDFAVRGGLVDFFTPGANAPVRVEFFGSEVDTIREFDVSNQRTTGRLQRIDILPKREIPITQESLEFHLEKLPEDDANYIRTRYLNDPELPGLEWLSILFGLPQGSLFEYLPENSVVVTRSRGALESETESVLDEARSLHARLSGRLSKLPEPEQYYVNPEGAFKKLDGFKSVDILPFKGGKAGIVSFDCQPHPSLGSRLDLLTEQIQTFEQTGVEFIIAVENEGQAERFHALISEKIGEDLTVPVRVANLRGGFVCQQANCAVLTDHEIFSRYHRRVRRKKFKEGVAIADYTALNRGDFVVHTDYGIAKYLGLETLDVDQKKRDCLTLEYAEKDRLFVPIEEFNRVSKYSGKDTDPQLTRLGGPGWEKLKSKTRKAIETLAEDLIELYAERKARRGHAFGDDTVWLRQLEASFPFEETPDQDRAIREVKNDMAGEQPTDRLICGDVGFGKTEVAIRAAFKAIDAGKQVAVLVPTTILAQQHFATFAERFADFPVKLGLLSRFRTRKQQLETLDELAAGKVDLVIGTHRLLSKDVAFNDLGLLVIDEEHRFGVRHKEKLRQLRATVDTIAMTATPIPRTLQMSMIGVRDMSLIATSPKDRLPISTEIVEFDPEIIATAILREMDRGGQVFFLHNRVQTIEAMRRFIKKIVPQAEIGVAHGQMHEKSLEGIMMAFLAGRYDVLLCTSIIESGLDIPNANTLIVNRADRFGLAQLYQIRGRVGRSNRRAYAYLVTPPMRQLAADAVKRLRALEAHSDLGSGFALAMRDLEIRGAGTLLGPKQSGFIEEIGFDLYNKLLEQAIAKLKGQELAELPETKLELNVETHIPDAYVNDSQQKVDVYRRIADCRSLHDLEHIREEVEDRFGRLPESTVQLFDAAAVKIAAAIVGIEKVKLRSGKANLFFAESHQLTRHQVESFRKATDCPMEFSLVGHPRIDLDLGPINSHERLQYLRAVLSRVV